METLNVSIHFSSLTKNQRAFVVVVVAAVVVVVAAVVAVVVVVVGFGFTIYEEEF